MNQGPTMEIDPARPLIRFIKRTEIVKNFTNFLAATFGED